MVEGKEGIRRGTRLSQREMYTYTRDRNMDETWEKEGGKEVEEKKEEEWTHRYEPIRCRGSVLLDLPVLLIKDLYLAGRGCCEEARDRR